MVDNASTDGTVDAVRSEFPAAELIVNDANLGFSAGNNAGIRRALGLGADWVLVLNNDVEVEAGFLAPLLDEAARRPDAAAFSPKILFAEPADVIWFAGASYDPRRGYNGRQRGYGERDDGRFDDVRETDRVCGAAMLVPRAVLERDGPLRRRALRVLRGHGLVAAGWGAVLRRAGEPRPPPGVGIVGRRELAGDALLRHAQRARGRGAARAARGVRYVAAAGGAALGTCRAGAPVTPAA